MTETQAKKRRRGRPRVADKRRKRAISMSDAEWQDLRAEATRLGVSVSALIRLRCLPGEE